MKIKFNLSNLLFFFSITLLVLSCSKDSDPNNPNDDFNKSVVTAKIDGKAFKSNPIITYGAIVNYPGITNFTFEGIDDNDARIAITGKLNSSSKGTYKIESNENEDYLIFAVYTINAEKDPSNAKSFYAPVNENEVVGEMTITEISEKRMKGTFYFTANELGNENSEVKITDGTFDIYFY